MAKLAAHKKSKRKPRGNYALTVGRCQPPVVSPAVSCGFHADP